MMTTPATGHMRLAIVGATGMVGGYALRYALALPGVERVTSISRRKTAYRTLNSMRSFIKTLVTALPSQGRWRVKTQRSFAWARIPAQ